MDKKSKIETVFNNIPNITESTVFESNISKPIDKLPNVSADIETVNDKNMKRKLITYPSGLQDNKNTKICKNNKLNTRFKF